jgi:hypothetical protein
MTKTTTVTDVQEEAALVERGGAMDARDRRGHSRDVIRLRGDWYFKCACGFVSTACLTEDAAWTEPCEIRELERVSTMRGYGLVFGLR